MVGGWGNGWDVANLYPGPGVLTWIRPSRKRPCISVDGFYIRGSGMVDDIAMLNDLPADLDTDGDGLYDVTRLTGPAGIIQVRIRRIRMEMVLTTRQKLMRTQTPPIRHHSRMQCMKMQRILRQRVGISMMMIRPAQRSAIYMTEPGTAR